MLRRYRVVVAGPGPHDDDRGAEVIARTLRDAGFEVVDLGAASTAVAVAETALQEDADAVGLALPSHPDPAFVPAVAAELATRGLADRAVVVVGDVTAHDVAELDTLGVAAPTGSVAAWLEEALDRHEHPTTTPDGGTAAP